MPKKPKLTARPTRLEPRKVMFLKKLSCSIGLLTRVSQKPKTINAASPTTRRVMMVAEPQP